MNKYVFVDSKGTVVREYSGAPQSPDDHACYEVPLADGIDYLNTYWDGTEFAPIPPKPETDSIHFDPASAAWVDDDIAVVQQSCFNQLKANYLSISEGIDPVTGKRIYVDCTVGETVYRMDTGRNSAETHDGGIRLAEMSGEETTFVVDFNNEVHYAVPIATAKLIAIKQAQDARNHNIEYQMFKQQIDGATTVTELRALSQVFTVNTL